MFVFEVSTDTAGRVVSHRHFNSVSVSVRVRVRNTGRCWKCIVTRRSKHPASMGAELVDGVQPIKVRGHHFHEDNQTRES